MSSAHAEHNKDHLQVAPDWMSNLDVALRCLRGLLGLPIACVVTLLFAALICPLLILGLETPARSLVVFWARGVLAALGVRAIVTGTPPHAANGFVMAASHASMLDAFVYPALFGRNTIFVGKAELRSIPVFGWAFGRLGNIFVNRAGGRKAAERMVSESLARAHHRSIFIHPEGTRSPDGELRRFKKGFVHIALETGKDVLPIASWPGHLLWPKGRLYPMAGTVFIHLGSPISTTTWTTSKASRHAEEVQAAIRNLLTSLRTSTPGK